MYDRWLELVRGGSPKQPSVLAAFPSLNLWHAGEELMQGLAPLYDVASSRKAKDWGSDEEGRRDVACGTGHGGVDRVVEEREVRGGLGEKQE